jgi:hypothetical protein
MTTAVFTLVAKPRVSASTSLSQLAKRFMNALVASRVKSAELELRRHRPFIRDLALSYGHEPVQSSEADLLPFKL